MIRGIEHIGITVTDIAKAEQFFINALEASVLYRIVPADKPASALEGKTMTRVNGFPAEMNITGLTMMRLKNGANVELFQVKPEVEEKATSIGEAGISHFSVYVEDIYQTGEKLRKNGAVMLDGPNDCFAQEQGQGNQTWFCRTPFGVLIELITLPSKIRYDSASSEARWIPQK